MEYRLNAPLNEETVRILRAGDKVIIDGIIYTGRDAAHQRLYGIIAEGGSLPFDVQDQIIYYTGPCPAPPGKVIGSAGPTTSGRMDKYTPLLLELGLRGMIGKGSRSPEVIDAMKKYGAVYFGAIGGAGALIARSVIKRSVEAFEDLGPEAIYRLEVRGFEVTVLIDSSGNNLYEIGRKEFMSSEFK